MKETSGTALAYRSTGFERFSYLSYFAGQNIFYYIIANFIMTYFSDIGIPAATIAIVMMVVKVWDAINDPIFGGIVDRTKFKKGKFLPWIRISLVLIPAATIFLFAIPSSLTVAAKVTWGIIGYMLWDTAYTICDVPIFGIVTTITGHQQERTKIMALGRIGAGVGTLLAIVLIPVVRESIGGWTPTMILLSVIGFVTMLPACISLKERVAPTAAQEEIRLRDMVRYVARNKYLLIFCGALAFTQATNMGSLGLLVARYCYGGEQWSAIIAVIAAAPMFAVAFITPALVKKVDKFVLFWWMNLAAAVFGLAAYFAGYGNMTLVIIMNVLKGIPASFAGVMLFMFTPDCIEYGTYKTGIDASGTGFAIQSFGTKLTAAICVSLAAALLAATGFIEGEGAVQLAGMPDKLWMISNLIPVAGIVIALPLFRFYKLRDKDVSVMTQANRNEISREEAERLLDGRF